MANIPDYEQRVPVRYGQVKSTASILAIIAAIGTFFIDSAALKFVVAVAAVLLGLVGFLKAASPRVSGGILSLVAIVIAVLGLLVAIFDAIF